MAADITTIISFTVLVVLKLLSCPFLTEFLKHLIMSRFDRGFFISPTITILCMDSCMTGLTKSNQIASLVGSAFRQRNLMVHFLCFHKDSFVITDFTKRMFAYIFVSDTFPSSAVPTAYSRISVVLLVAFVLFLFMLLTKPSLCKFWASRITARSFRFSWHLIHLLLDIRKASQEFSPTRLVHCTFLLILLYHIVELDIFGQMWTFRAFYIFIGFSGSSTCVNAFPCHLLTVRESAPRLSPICSQV